MLIVNTEAELPAARHYLESPAPRCFLSFGVGEVEGVGRAGVLETQDDFVPALAHEFRTAVSAMAQNRASVCRSTDSARL